MYIQFKIKLQIWNNNQYFHCKDNNHNTKDIHTIQVPGAHNLQEALNLVLGNQENLQTQEKIHLKVNDTESKIPRQ